MTFHNVDDIGGRASMIQFDNSRIYLRHLLVAGNATDRKWRSRKDSY